MGQGISRRRKTAEPTARELRELARERAELAERFFAESPMKTAAGKESAAAKRALCDTLAALHQHLRIMCDRRDRGIATTDETRTFPAVASGIRRLSESLGLTGPTEQDPEDLKV